MENKPATLALAMLSLLVVFFLVFVYMVSTHPRPEEGQPSAKLGELEERLIRLENQTLPGLNPGIFNQKVKEEATPPLETPKKMTTSLFGREEIPITKKTTRCIMCGSPAVWWTGHVKRYREPEDEDSVINGERIIAGWCDSCNEKRNHNLFTSQIDGNFGMWLSGYGITEIDWNTTDRKKSTANKKVLPKH